MVGWWPALRGYWGYETVQNLAGEQNRKNVVVAGSPVSRRVSFSPFDVAGLLALPGSGRSRCSRPNRPGTLASGFGGLPLTGGSPLSWFQGCVAQAAERG